MPQLSNGSRGHGSKALPSPPAGLRAPQARAVPCWPRTSGHAQRRAKGTDPASSMVISSYPHDSVLSQAIPVRGP